jgi:hypothetical protein
LGVRGAGADGSWRLLDGNDVAAWEFAPMPYAVGDSAAGDPADRSVPDLGPKRDASS